MDGAWERCEEPLRSTVLRNGSIAAGIGLAVGVFQRQVAAGALSTVVALWFTFGGHFAEVLFRNLLRFRLYSGPVVQAGARLVYWFVAGAVLYEAAFSTLTLLTDRTVVRWHWWTAGVFFVAVELLVHLFLRARGHPSFYDGRG